MRRRPVGFATRLGVASTVLVALVCAGLSWEVARGILDDLRGRLAQRGRTVLATLATETARGLQRGDVAALAAAAERAYAQGDVVAVRLFDANGLVLVATGARTPLRPRDVGAASDAVELPGVGLDLWQDVGDGERLGAAEVVVSLDVLEAVRRRIERIAGWLTLAFMVAGALGAWLIARAMTRPLAELARAAGAMAAGDFGARVAVRRGDEVGTAAAAFNGMAESLARSHRALEVKIEELDHANRLKSEFLATVSHELRTPLNVIIGNAEMLVEAAPGSPEHAELVAAVRRYAELQLDLVTSVLDFERLASGEVTCRVASFALGPLIDDVLALHATRVRPGVQFAAHVAPDCPALETDRLKLHQIVRNLVDNAVKFTESGRIVVEAGPGPTPDRVTITVTDTGPGVPAAEVAQIFEPFRQLGSTRAMNGVGLGLSIVRRLTEVLGGEVTLSSEPGWGSTFRVTLPCRLPATARVASGGPTPARRAA